MTPFPEAAVAFHYATREKQAALGPVSEAEWQAQRAAVAKRAAERQAALAALGPGTPQMMLLLGGTSLCFTNVPAYLTNLVCAFDTNQGWTVTFEVQGGTDGLQYDLFTTTNLIGNYMTNSQWTWLERGPTCSLYQYTNQPATYAFYILGTPQDSDSDGLTDAWEQLVAKTDPSNADTDGDGLSDGYEVSVYHTNPKNADSDGDGLRDGSEVLIHASNPNEAAVLSTNGVINLQVFTPLR